MDAISKDSVMVKQYKNSLKINTDALLVEVVKKNRDIILEAEKNQLQFGLGSDGKKITPSYASDDYAFDKHQQNALPGLGNPDLFKSGDMYKNMDLTLTGTNQYFFVSNVSYFNDLTDKYKTAFALSAKSLKPIREKVTADYNKAYHTKLNA